MTARIAATARAFLAGDGGGRLCRPGASAGEGRA